MLIIRLTRTGKKNAPKFRVVLIKKTAPPKSGKFSEILGSYNPRSKEISLNKERIQYWLSQGVPTSETVHNLLVAQGVIKGPKIKKKLKIKKKKSATDTEEKPAEEKKEEKPAEEKKEEKPTEEKKEEKSEEKPKEEEIDKTEKKE
ncbi:MAG: 30S ribosomal protein S16 [Parcubacteria group bacterium]|jgi:small subunit ribosomal protein S16|nr:30S ribosomal protein S16 [Parcubacteria group bacterium]|tara:strand:- start:3439 stop:3876 length:438 start_codon:yes stop_codon:yes gene_type:complete